MKTLKITSLLYLIFLVQIGHSQVLHTENFNVIIDSTKILKGDFSPSFRYRNLKDDLLEISNISDISMRLKNHVFTVANRLEYSFLGNERLLSGGFIYLEYVNLKIKKITLEPFIQMHWNEVRGLDRKYAGGVNLRWRALVKNKTGVYFGIGSMYEFERWNYSGVTDELLPLDQSPVKKSQFRGTSYLSFKQKIGDLFNLDISGYFQPTYSSPLKDYRLASSIELTYNVTKYLGLRILYQNIYDHSPLIPIDKLYNDLSFGLTISF